MGAVPLPPRPRTKTKPGEVLPELPQIVRLRPGMMVPTTRYRIVEFLGDGGMGEVYEAEHVDLERRVALKILLPSVCRNPEVLQLFRTEAKAASRIGSETIVELYDFAELPDGRLMFTMELLNGPTLAEEIDNGPMAPSRVIAILRQVCKGLAAAHEAGIVHRDIKPDNLVLIHKRGRPDTVKILDFGIAAIVGDDNQAVARPLKAGTPHYVAPELIEGGEFDDRVDIYALGCTAYAMLTGRPPYTASGADAVVEILAQHLSQPVPSLVNRRAELSKVRGLCAVIERCLAKSPDDRYSSMDELEADLCGAQISARLDTSWDDLPLPDRVPIEIRERLVREMPDVMHGFEPKRRGWLWATLTLAALGLGIGGTYFMLSRRAPAPEIADSAEPAEEAAAAPAPGISAVDQLVADARAAAGQAYYVYPPADDPERPTAYTKIRELEALQGADGMLAAQRAVELRHEFASALVRLGDGYWEREGGKEFASEYYAQALVFEREHPVASERATLAETSAEDLAAKAEAGNFTTEEIQRADSQRRSARPDRTSPAAAVAATPIEPPAEPKAMSEEQKSARDLAKIARERMKKGDLAGAQEYLDRAAVFDPKDDLVLVTRYELALKRGNKQQALDHAKALVARTPASAEHSLRLGDAHAALDQWPKAYAAYLRAQQLGSAAAGKKVLAAAAKGGGPAPGSEPKAPPTSASDAAGKAGPTASGEGDAPAQGQAAKPGADKGDKSSDEAPAFWPDGGGPSGAGTP
jgi:tRNA A-37 threonylcarbamoyl transferase component Bud32/tetratricopeptide (TPR) repeat protein